MATSFVPTRHEKISHTHFTHQKCWFHGILQHLTKVTTTSVDHGDETTAKIPRMASKLTEAVKQDNKKTKDKSTKNERIFVCTGNTYRNSDGPSPMVEVLFPQALASTCIQVLQQIWNGPLNYYTSTYIEEKIHFAKFPLTRPRRWRGTSRRWNGTFMSWCFQIQETTITS